jgi:hypothetical protein
MSLTSSLGIGGAGVTGGVAGYIPRWLTPTTLGTSTLIDNGVVAGINATSSLVTFNVQALAGQNPFRVSSSFGDNLVTINSDGKIIFGSTTDANIFINGGSTTTPAVNSNSVAIGNEALVNVSTSASLQNIAIGYQALFGSSTDLMTGTDNIALGYLAGSSNTTGSYNSFFGYGAGMFNTTGAYNNFIGLTAGVFYEVWRIIRDISGIFFIFVLLVAAIKIILGLDTKISEVIKNIVIAGVLINFSFFFVSVLIDASNIVSQTIYNAMIPNSPKVSVSDFGPAVSDGKGGSTGGIKALTQKYFSNTPSKGSITDIFMQSLSIQSLYNKQLMDSTQYKAVDKNSSNGVMTMIKIILIAIVGSIIMFTAGASFMIAAGAFIVRLVILLFLLAFSPIYFAGMIIPGIKEYVTDFTKQLQAQLIFMPVYLLLMYVALRVLNESKILGTGYMQLYQGSLSGSWAIDLISLGINFAIVIVILNIPLIGAMKLGGAATKMFSGLADKYGGTNVWKNFGSFAGRGFRTHRRGG